MLQARVLLLTAALCVGTVGAQITIMGSQAPDTLDPHLDPQKVDSQTAEASDLVFRQNVRRVVVDVVVSDSKGKPVSGLTAKDFSIAEDGKAQPIRNFDVHDFDLISDSSLKAPSSLPLNTFVNVPDGPERGPLYVLLLDLLNMEVDDQPAARQQLLKFARSKPLGTRFAVFVLSDGLYLLQGFTEDRNRLADLLDPKNSHSHLPRIFLYADNFRPAISTPMALMKIAQFLAELPGHKNVIWISASFPSATMPSSDPGNEGLSISDQIKETTDALARGQIAVYPIDVRGVAGTGASASDVSSRSNASTSNSADYALNARHMTEEEIADATGGRAFYNTNDLASALTEATETGAHYYTLTYSPSNQNYDGGMRHIHVALANRGYRLAYRHSYFGNPSPPPEPAKALHPASDLESVQTAQPADSLYPNMQHGAPLAHQLLFRAHIHAVAPPRKATPQQMANLADQASYFRARSQKHRDKSLRPIQLQTYEIDYTVAARYPALEIAAAAFDEDGKMVNGMVQRAAQDHDQIFAGTRRDGIYRIQQHFDVPMSAVSVRLGVRDIATDNVGAVEVNLPLDPEPTTEAKMHSDSSHASDQAGSTQQ
ncbi:MAG TPA: VWA domain-containing protein [Candidatus Sulfotelmatobacter sp.]